MPLSILTAWRELLMNPYSARTRARVRRFSAQLLAVPRPQPNAPFRTALTGPGPTLNGPARPGPTRQVFSVDVAGCRIVKAGSNAIHACVSDLDFPARPAQVRPGPARHGPARHKGEGAGKSRSDTQAWMALEPALTIRQPATSTENTCRVGPGRAAPFSVGPGPGSFGTGRWVAGAALRGAAR